jgi:hypothetical protein
LVLTLSSLPKKGGKKKKKKNPGIIPGQRHLKYTGHVRLFVYPSKS